MNVWYGFGACSRSRSTSRFRTSGRRTHANPTAIFLADFAAHALSVQREAAFPTLAATTDYANNPRVSIAAADARSPTAAAPTQTPSSPAASSLQVVARPGGNAIPLSTLVAFCRDIADNIDARTSGQSLGTRYLLSIRFDQQQLIQMLVVCLTWFAGVLSSILNCTEQ